MYIEAVLDKPRPSYVRVLSLQKSFVNMCACTLDVHVLFALQVLRIQALSGLVHSGYRSLAPQSSMSRSDLLV